MSLLVSGLVYDKSVILKPRIVVIGVGGGGCNAVNNMIQHGIKDVEFVVANTDYQTLSASLCDRKLQLGAGLTKGLGAGSSPEIGYKAAEESMNEIDAVLDGANLVFITTGMGGGTGTGASPIIAKIAKQKGILTVGVVTKPFSHEQDRRIKIADQGIARMEENVDTLITISNQNLFRISNEKTLLQEAFQKVDHVLYSCIKCVTTLITEPGLVNLDFADLVSVMQYGGKALMGSGESSGEGRALKAAEMAINNPLLECHSIKGAKGLLINIIGDSSTTLFEISEVVSRISQEADPDANIKHGSVIDPNLKDKLIVSVVATGISGIKKVESVANSSHMNVNMGAQYDGGRYDASKVVPIDKYRQNNHSNQAAPQRGFDSSAGYHRNFSGSASSLSNETFGEFESASTRNIKQFAYQSGRVAETEPVRQNIKPETLYDGLAQEQDVNLTENSEVDDLDQIVSQDQSFSSSSPIVSISRKVIHVEEGHEGQEDDTLIGKFANIFKKKKVANG